MTVLLEESRTGPDARTEILDLAVHTVSGPDRETVVVRGELDMATVPLLRAVLDGVHARRPARVDIDLDAVTFLDASAVTTFIAARRRLAAHRAELVLCNPSPIARRVLALTGFDRVVPVVGQDR